MRVRSIKHQVDRTQEDVPRREFNASKPGLEFSGRNVEVVAKRLLATQQLARALQCAGLKRQTIAYSYSHLCP